MPIETYEMLQAVCGDDALNRSTVFDWLKQFKDEGEDLQDDPRSEHPSTSQNP
jgi:transposase